MYLCIYLLIDWLIDWFILPYLFLITKNLKLKYSAVSSMSSLAQFFVNFLILQSAGTKFSDLFNFKKYTYISQTVLNRYYCYCYCI